MSSLIELQRKLQENRDRIEARSRQGTQPPYVMGGNGNYNNRSTNYKSRTASITRE